MKSKFIKNRNNIKLHVVREEQQGTPVILSHGFQDNWQCMKKISKNLPDKFYSIMHDTKAHGISEAPKDGYSTKNLARDIQDITQKICKKPPILLGHSMGANTSAVASEIIEVEALVLEDPAGKISRKNNHNKIEEKFEKWRIKTQSKIEKQLKQNHTNLSNKEIKNISLARKQLRPEAAEIGKNGFKEIKELLPNKPPQTLLLRPDPNKISYSIEEKIEKNKIKRKEIPQSKHTIRRHNFQNYIKKVSTFLQSSAL